MSRTKTPTLAEVQAERKSQINRLKDQLGLSDQKLDETGEARVEALLSTLPAGSHEGLPLLQSLPPETIRLVRQLLHLDCLPQTRLLQRYLAGLAPVEVVH